MDGLSIEMRIRDKHGLTPTSLPIERPGGFDDETYRIHVACTAEQLRHVMSGEVDYILRRSEVTVTMMVVDDATPQQVIEEAFLTEHIRQLRDSDPGRSHLIELQTVE